VGEARTIAVLGGTGAMGSGLARRWARFGHRVIIGSRDAARAKDAAQKIGAELGTDNIEAAKAGEIVVLTVPFENQRATLESVREQVQGKILIDVTVPLRPPKVSTVQLPPEGSAAMIAQAVLGQGVHVVSAFQNVGAKHVGEDGPIDCDVLVSGDDPSAREVVIELARDAGMRGVHAGPLANAAVAEALTSILIGINRRYKIDRAGVRITGLPPKA
jgi:NADPH-dependent F420 reductase